MDQKRSGGGSHEEILLQGKRGNEGRPENQENPAETEGPKHMPVIEVRSLS